MTSGSVLIKLADRLHNMRTLDHLPPDRQEEISRETLEIYAPIAHRLGIYWLKSELEDYAFRYLNPSAYATLKAYVAKTRAEREEYIRSVLEILSRRLKESGVEAEVTGRPKHFFSIHSKMQQEELNFDQIYDLVAFRIIVPTLRECYEALGVVHANWKPIPGRFKDYIALPKVNMYQSLHSTVIGPRGQRMEVQIRTREMHEVAELGIAAHWSYKEGAGPAQSRDTERFAWLRRLIEWQQNLKDPQEFLSTVKDDLFAEEVFVFTPKGDLLDFPLGATVIDFAYRIHSQVGQHLAGARVNGPHGAAALPAEIGRHGRGDHRRTADAGQGLGESRGDGARQEPDPAMAARAAGGAFARARRVANRSRTGAARLERDAVAREAPLRARAEGIFASRRR